MTTSLLVGLSQQSAKKQMLIRSINGVNEMTQTPTTKQALTASYDAAIARLTQERDSIPTLPIWTIAHQADAALWIGEAGAKAAEICADLKIALLREAHSLCDGVEFSDRDAVDFREEEISTMDWEFNDIREWAEAIEAQVAA